MHVFQCRSLHNPPLYSDLLSWVNDRKTVIAAEEFAKDMSGAESLLQRHRERKVCSQAPHVVDNVKRPCKIVI